jgi:hypothetical protein
VNGFTTQIFSSHESIKIIRFMDKLPFYFFSATTSIERYHLLVLSNWIVVKKLHAIFMVTVVVALL